MIFIYTLIYISLSLVLILIGLIKKRYALNLFGYALMLNIFPLILAGQLDMNKARILGIPIAYIPMIASGIVIFFYNGLNINKKDKNLLIMMVIFLSYAFIVSMIKGSMSVTTFIYWLMWLFNFWLLLSTINIFSKLKNEISVKILYKLFLIFSLGSLVGILKYLTGITIDSNFMPMFNRNGTVVIVVMIMPLIFYLKDIKKINNITFWTMYFIIFLCMLLLGSRSGLLGVMFTSVLYLIFSKKIQIGKLIFLLIFIIGIMFTPVAKNINQRFATAVISIETLASGKTIKAGKNDYNRNMLLLSAIQIIQNEFWFGTGIGLENYRRAFHKYATYHHDSKAHNFYLSYFAELGLVGFSLLLTILIMIYKRLSNNKELSGFKISFLGISFMMLFNEYIGVPELWFFYGMLIGTNYVYKKNRR